MPAKIDVIGQRFGRLVALSDDAPARGRRRVLCICDCGVRKTVDPRDLRRGHATSCGCAQKERVGEICRARSTHGMTKTVEHDTWQKMLGRCRNRNNPKFKDYGGRGITVCDRWLQFEAFLSDMGLRPTGATLDRIDVNGNYEPDNCRWATKIEQARNKRKHRFVELGGRHMPLSEACEIAGINYRSALYRVNRGLAWQPLPAPPQERGDG